MSTSTYPYFNPLDEFVTFSTHYILTVAGTTEALRNMTSGGGSVINAVGTTMLGEKFFTDAGQQATARLIIDTRRFAQFSITDLHMQHAYGTGPINNPTTQIGQHRMTVQDSTGLSFFNLLMDTFRNGLQTSRASAHFMLSILFIGHTDSGQTVTVSTCNIPLMFSTLSFNLSSSGSVFNIEFYELSGGPQGGEGLAHLDYMGGIQSATSDSSNTLGSMIRNLETSLNVQSLEFYQKYRNGAARQFNDNRVFGKLIQYMITIPSAGDDNWAEFEITNASRSQNTEQMFISTAEGFSPDETSKTDQTVNQQVSSGRISQISFSQDTQITTAIKMILESSDKFVKLASKENVVAGTAKSFKTLTTITSDDTTYIIHIDILPHYLKKIQPPSNKISAGVTTGQVVNKPLKANFIEYDYIFTGKNTHITKLDIAFNPTSIIAIDTNIQLGGAKHAANAAAGNTKAAAASQAKGAPSSVDFSPQILAKDPIFIPIRTKDQKGNAVSVKGGEELGKEQAAKLLQSRQEYTQTYANLHFMSSSMMDLEIRGNPNIIRKYADVSVRGGIPTHLQQPISEDTIKGLDVAGSNAQSNFEKTLLQPLENAKKYHIANWVQPKIDSAKDNKAQSDYLAGPDVSVGQLFVKINIKAPNTDWAGNYKMGESLFTDHFFFNGYYQVMTIDTHISDGQFLQTMKLIPQDLDGTFSASNDDKSK
jgi:hypothetical protein